MIDRDVALLLTGAGIALISSLITAWMQHLLSLRADRIKRERDKSEKEAQQQREQLVEGASTWAISERLEPPMVMVPSPEPSVRPLPRCSYSYSPVVGYIFGMLIVLVLGLFAAQYLSGIQAITVIGSSIAFLLLHRTFLRWLEKHEAAE